MRLLYLALTWPLPANNGHRLRLWLTLRTLAELGHQLHLLAFAEPSDGEIGPSELDAVCATAQALPLERAATGAIVCHLSRLCSLASPLPYAALHFSSPRMRAQIANLLAHHRIDAIIAHTVFSLVNLPETDLPVVVNSPDVEHEIFERYGAASRNPLARLYARREASRTRHWERMAYSRASRGMACSGRDRSQLDALGTGTKVFVVPNAVDVARSVPTGGEAARRVLFIGALDWLPNRDAVRFFIERILPQVSVRHPDVEFIVAGRNAPERFRRAFERPPRVQFTGSIPDMRGEIVRATVSVAPLRIGSGTRLKILEAAAMAKPVVATTLGAEGLEFTPGTEILVEDHPARFADAVNALLEDSELRHAIGHAGRAVVERAYSAAALRQSLALALDGLGAAHPENGNQRAQAKSEAHATATAVGRAPNR